MARIAERSGSVVVPAYSEWLAGSHSGNWFYKVSFQPVTWLLTRCHHVNHIELPLVFMANTPREPEHKSSFQWKTKLFNVPKSQNQFGIKKNTDNSWRLLDCLETASCLVEQFVLSRTGHCKAYSNSQRGSVWWWCDRHEVRISSYKKVQIKLQCVFLCKWLYKYILGRKKKNWAVHWRFPGILLGDGLVGD